MINLEREWMFCAITGDLLEMDAAAGVARCDICGWTRDLAELENITLKSTINIKEFRRAYNIDPLVNEDDEEANPGFQKQQRPTIDEECTKCGHHQLEYYTMQLRSADEGQTVFYECPACGDRTRQNN